MGINDYFAIVAAVVVLASLVFLVWNFIVNARRSLSAKPKHRVPDWKGITVVLVTVIGLAIAIILKYLK